MLLLAASSLLVASEEETLDGELSELLSSLLGLLTLLSLDAELGGVCSYCKLTK